MKRISWIFCTVIVCAVTGYLGPSLCRAAISELSRPHIGAIGSCVGVGLFGVGWVQARTDDPHNFGWALVPMIFGGLLLFTFSMIAMMGRA